MSIKSPYTLTISLSTITILSGIFLSSNIVFATDTNTSQDNVAVSVPVSCTMNGTGMTSHTANIPNGTYESEIGTTTLKSFCNDSQGFAIYAIGYTNEEYGNTNLIGTSGGQTIITGTATTTGNPDVSNWAVKLATDSTATYPLTLDNSFGSYSSVPSSYTKVAHRDSGTDLGSSATGAELTTTYAAYISKNQKADTYDGKVKFTLVHPASEVPLQPVACEARRICYNPNTATAVGQMGKETIFSGETSANLFAPNFKRDGYGFAGWNDKYDYTGTTYGPNQTITVTDDMRTNGLSLYAIWIKSAGTLQNWSGCSGMSIGDVTALTDNRDNDTYAVAKLADNKCWMIENLRLDDSPELSSTNTHNPSLPLNNSWYYQNQQGTLTTSNHLSATSNPTSTNPDTAWCQTHSSDCDDQSMLATNNTTLYTSSTSSITSNTYSYGNYYNWYSATGGHGKYGNNYGSNYTAPGDICPAGWRLPIGIGATGDFGILSIAMGDTGGDEYTEEASQRWRSYPNNFIYSGRVYGSSIYDRNSNGNYWTATALNGDSSYHFELDSSSVHPSTAAVPKYTGRSVRCIAGV